MKELPQGVKNGAKTAGWFWGAVVLVAALVLLISLATKVVLSMQLDQNTETKITSAFWIVLPIALLFGTKILGSVINRKM